MIDLAELLRAAARAGGASRSSPTAAATARRRGGPRGTRRARAPALGAGAVCALRGRLPATAAAANPVDLAGGGEQDIRTFERLPRLCSTRARSTRCCSPATSAATARTARRCRGRRPRPPRTRSRGGDTGRPSSCSRCTGRNAATGAAPGGRPGVPRRRARPSRARRASRRRPAPDGVPQLPPPPAIDRCGYAAARALLAEAGVAVRAAQAVRPPTEAVAAASAVGYPVVLKALGVAAQVRRGRRRPRPRDEAALRAAVAADCARPGALSVEHMARARLIELLVGCAPRRPLRPGAAAGLGGVFAEVLDDVAVALAPVEPRGAERLLARSAARRSCSGARGRAAARRPRRGRGGRGAVARRRRASRDRRDRGQPAARARDAGDRPRRPDRYSVEVGRRAALESPRAMISRWISLVPSQIRSTRSSR